MLDVGCGTGRLARLLTLHRCTSRRIGLDIWIPHIEKAKKSKSYDDLVISDIRNLPFKDKCII